MGGLIEAWRGLSYAMAAAVWMCAAPSWAQTCPSKPVRWVIPFDAGTSPGCALGEGDQ